MIMSESPSKTQVGGSHYKDMAIQPFHFAMANQFNAFQFAVVKYASRYLNKNGVQDLLKIIHFCELEIERLVSLKEADGSESQAPEKAPVESQAEDGELEEKLNAEFGALVWVIECNPQEFLHWSEVWPTPFGAVDALVRTPVREDPFCQHQLSDYICGIRNSIKWVFGFTYMKGGTNEAQFELAMRSRGFEFGMYRVPEMYNYLKEFQELILSGKFEEFTETRKGLKAQEVKPTK